MTAGHLFLPRPRRNLRRLQPSATPRYLPWPAVNDLTLLSACCRAILSCWITGSGVPLGAASPSQISTLKPGSTVSASVGMSGYAAGRRLPVVASARILFSDVSGQPNDAAKCQLDIACHQIDEGTGYSGIGNVNCFDTGAALEKLSRQMRSAADAGRSKTQLVGVLGPVIDQLAYAFDWQVVRRNDDYGRGTYHGRPKVDVVADHLKRIDPGASITKVKADLRSIEAFDALKTCDVLLGAVDNDGARAILTEFAAAYLIPYFDAASDVLPATATDGVRPGGRIFCWWPGRPCCTVLKCWTGLRFAKCWPPWRE